MAGKFNLRIDNAVLTFRNFAGSVNERGYGGRRQFSVYLDGYNYKGEIPQDEDSIPRYKYGPNWVTPAELVPILQKDNWNVKFYPKEERVLENGVVISPRPYLTVNVKFYPEDDPRARFNSQLDMAKSDGGITRYDEDSADTFDTVWIKQANVLIRPFEYKKKDGVENGPVSAELAKLFVVPVEDRFDDEEDTDFYNGYGN